MVLLEATRIEVTVIEAPPERLAEAAAELGLELVELSPDALELLGLGYLADQRVRPGWSRAFAAGDAPALLELLDRALAERAAGGAALAVPAGDGIGALIAGVMGEFTDAYRQPDPFVPPGYTPDQFAELVEDAAAEALEAVIPNAAAALKMAVMAGMPPEKVAEMWRRSGGADDVGLMVGAAYASYRRRLPRWGAPDYMATAAELLAQVYAQRNGGK